MSVVYKCIELPGKEFTSKHAMFKAIKAKKNEIIGLKKAQVKHSDSLRFVAVHGVDAEKGINVPDGHVMAVINTTKYMDSHNDVHLNGIWSKSVEDQQGKIYFIADHDLSVKSVIAFPNDVDMMVKSIDWKDLGADFPGTTQALIFKVRKEDIVLDAAKHIIEEKLPIEHSVRMQYVTIKFAVNSDSPDFAEEKKEWDHTIELVANKDIAIENGYYWTVSEAKIFKEGSMVLAGSNDVTPMLLSSKNIAEPSDDTLHAEPSADTQEPPKPKSSELDYITQNLY